MRVWYLNSPYHSGWVGGDWDHGGTTALPQLRFKKDDYFRSKTAYDWVVTDQPSEPDTNDGHLARGEAVFMIQGSPEFYKKDADRVYEGDEWIDARSGMRFSQAHLHSDDPVARVNIDAVGQESAAIRAKLVPGVQIFSVNGTPVPTLTELRAALAAIHEGGTAVIVTGNDQSKRTFSLHLN